MSSSRMIARASWRASPLSDAPISSTISRRFLPIRLFRPEFGASCSRQPGRGAVTSTARIGSRSAPPFSTMTRDPALHDAADAARNLLGGPVDAVDRARGFGRNSGIYRVRRGGTSYALKQYPPRQPGERDRAGVELGALRFMIAHGIGSVPRPFAGDPKRGYALIEWVDGAAVTAPSAADIAAAAGFLAAIH